MAAESPLCLRLRDALLQSSKVPRTASAASPGQARQAGGREHEPGLTISPGLPICSPNGSAAEGNWHVDAAAAAGNGHVHSALGNGHVHSAVGNGHVHVAAGNGHVDASAGNGHVDAAARSAVAPSCLQLSSVATALWDQGIGKEDILRDVLAYQVVHNEFADIIGDVASRLDLFSAWTPSPPPPPSPPPEPEAAQRQGSDVDEWVSSLLHPSTQIVDVLQAAGPPDQGKGLEAGSPAQEEKSVEEMVGLLLECAKAVVAYDVDDALRLVSKIQEFSTPHGSGLQRTCHYFLEALVAKLNGTGAELYTAVVRGDRSSTFRAERGYRSHLAKDPRAGLENTFANGVLLQAFQGAERVHIVDYGILNGYQWPNLMQAMAYQPGGPPELRITGIEFPQPGKQPDFQLRETGARLRGIAENLGIPFKFHAIAGKWEEVQITDVPLRDNEVLAVNCMFRLRHVLDELVLPSNPRKLILERIRKMKPKVFVTGVLSRAGNAPFLMSRLPPVFQHTHCLFDFLDCAAPRDDYNRQVVEESFLGRDIMNVIACEGAERRERSELYTQWHRIIANTGFELLPFNETLFEESLEIMQDYHEGWNLQRDQGWLLLAWKQFVTHGFAAWQPKLRKGES